MGPFEMISLGFVCFTIVACGVMVLVALRRRTPAPDRAFEANVVDRLNRIEQAVDAIAVEVERVTESQRFVTKLMAERGAPKLSAQSIDADK